MIGNLAVLSKFLLKKNLRTSRKEDNMAVTHARCCKCGKKRGTRVAWVDGKLKEYCLKCLQEMNDKYRPKGQVEK